MGLKRLFKKIGKGLKRAFKSKLGKLMLAGAALYFTGGAGLAAKGTGGTAAQAGAEAGKSALDAVSGTGGVPLPGIAMQAQQATGGFLNKAIKGVGSFVERNPMASSMLFNAVASANAPDEIDLLREQERIRRERWQNMEVPDSIGIRPGVGILNGGMR